ncbi:unnamed protein product [Aureobasidium vineae]|uniref:Uncharacterized protein n=1 Tax=Aureobasidium vineae TaxID=2773715 RepID=A0A9N8JRF0_9PEZI|nr:unnamed protein product [Aureobasidium vineae]
MIAPALRPVSSWTISTYPMEHQYMTQTPMQSPMYYYTPQKQQHIHYNSHMAPQNMDYFSQPVSSHVLYSQRSSPLYQQQPQYISQAMLTPAASPRPQHQKPTIMLQQEMHNMNMSFDSDCYGPATPTLSATSFNSADSPQSNYHMMPTPANELHMNPFDGLKQNCEDDMFGEWTHSYLLSTSACPSLSPSPSPIPRSAINDASVCDPRTLTVPSNVLPCLPTLCAGDDEEHKLILKGDFTPSKTFDAFELMPANHGFPTFEPLFELDVEDDFCASKRQRLDSHFTNDSSFCFTDASFSDEDLTFSPCQSEFSFTSGPVIDMTPARRTVAKRSDKVPQYAAAGHSTNSQPQQVPSNAAASSSSSASGDDHSHSGPSSSSTTRRGRKQSLTEDPSKTFSETPDASELGAMLFDHAAAVAGSSSSSQSGYESAEDNSFQQKKRKRDD